MSMLGVRIWLLVWENQSRNDLALKSWPHGSVLQQTWILMEEIVDEKVFVVIG